MSDEFQVLVQQFCGSCGGQNDERASLWFPGLRSEPSQITESNLVTEGIA
jgi:hypothetical protein